MGKGLVILGVIVVAVVAIVVLMPGFFTGLFNSTYDHNGKEVDVTADSLFTTPADWPVVPGTSSADPSLYPSTNKTNATFLSTDHRNNIVTYAYRAYSPVGGAVEANNKNIQIHIMVFDTADNAISAYLDVVLNTPGAVKYNKFEQAVKKIETGADSIYIFRDMNVVGYVVVHPGIGDSGQTLTSGNLDTFMVAFEKKIHDAGKKIST